MSEYQYYEFAATDGPISDEGAGETFRVRNARIARTGGRGWWVGRDDRIESAGVFSGANPGRSNDEVHGFRRQNHRDSGSTAEEGGRSGGGKATTRVRAA